MTTRPLTSIERPIVLNPICTTGKGTLYLTFAPGKTQPATRSGDYDRLVNNFLRVAWDRDLDLDLARIRDVYNATDIVCLLEDHEFESLCIQDYKEAVGRYGLELLHHPIRDRDIPSCMERYHELITEIYTKISNDRDVVVHCAGGQGRAGTVGSGVLCAAGMQPIEAIRTVQERRPNSIKRPSQQQFVCEYARIYHSK